MDGKLHISVSEKRVKVTPSWRNINVLKGFCEKYSTTLVSSMIQNCEEVLGRAILALCE